MVLKIKIIVMRVSRWHAMKVCINRGGRRQRVSRVFQCHSTPTLQSHSDTSTTIISLLCKCISAHAQRLGHKGHIASPIGADRKLLVWLLTCFWVSNVSISDCQWDKIVPPFSSATVTELCYWNAVWKKMHIWIIDASISFTVGMIMGSVWSWKSKISWMQKLQYF